MNSRRDFLRAGTGTLMAAPFLRASQSDSGFPLEEITLAELRSGLERGHFTCEELTRLYLGRIQRLDRSGARLNAVIEVNPEALTLARMLDAERRQGKVRGLLHGIPVLIKDNIATADRMQTTAGSLALVGAGAPRGKDSFVAAQLRAAGALPLGKTNLSEWANFRSTHAASGWSGRGGLTRCPYVLDRNPSGSSSGSAVAVSANLCAVAVGTETDGSIVSPCCSNGIAGLKPTVGLIGRSGIVPISHSQDTAGPMGRTVADVAILLTALAGADADDHTVDTALLRGRPARHVDYTTFLDANGLRGKRLGVIRKYAGFNIAVDRMFAAALEEMREAGAEIVDPVDMPTIGKWDDLEQTVLSYEFKADLNHYLAQLGRGAKIHSLAEAIAFNKVHAAQEMPYFGQELFEQAQKRGGLEEEAYRKARAQCVLLTREKGIDAALRQHRLDALICPTGTPAWTTDLLNGDPTLASSSSLPAVAGYPHVTVPMGAEYGLPVGLSFIAGAWQEGELLRLAYAYEQGSRKRKAPEYRQKLTVNS